MEKIINKYWDTGETPSFEILSSILKKLDQGELRICEKKDQTWITHQWLKKTILLVFKHFPSSLTHSYSSSFFDKIPLKFQNWTEANFKEHQLRCVPGAIVRHSAYLGARVIVMPAFINVGAYVGDGTMIDTWANIGSCAQIGKNCHISMNVGIGGVLEPIQDNPVIIEDDCFIGAGSCISEGVLVEEGAVIGTGVFIGSSTKIWDRESGQILYGRIPPYSVVVPGNLANQNLDSPSLACAVIVKKVDPLTRKKTAVNLLLR